MSAQVETLPRGHEIDYSLIRIPMYDNNLTDTQRAIATQLDFSIEQKLYGYCFRGATILIPFAALFIYVTMVLIHMVLISFGRRWTSKAWSSLGEFFAVALRSPPPQDYELHNTGGGTKVKETWRLKTSIREL